MNLFLSRIRATRRSDAETVVCLAKRRRWFDDEGDAEDKGNEGKNDKGGAGSEKPTFTHTQDDLNKAAGKARSEGRQAGVNELLKELGFEKADELKALIADARKRADDEKSESQKAAEAAEREKKRAEDAEAALAQERAARAEERRDNALLAELREQGAKDAELSLIGLKARKADDVKALLAEDGSVNAEKVKKLVTDAKTAYADQFGGNRHPGIPGSGSHSGGRSPSPHKEAEAEARRTNQRILRG